MVPGSTLALASPAAYRGWYSGRKASVAEHFRLEQFVCMLAPLSAHAPTNQRCSVTRSLAVYFIVEDLVSEYNDNGVWLGTQAKLRSGQLLAASETTS